MYILDNLRNGVVQCIILKQDLILTLVRLLIGLFIVSEK